MFKYNQKTRLSHRVSWELTNGPIPKGICVLHKCDNPLCVNPSHLFLGTYADNMKDMTIKGRQARGTSIYTHKLTEENVLHIRSLELPMKDIAEMYKVHRTTISRIRSRKTWRYI